MRGFLKFLLWFCGIAAFIVGLLHLTLFDAWTVPVDDPQLAASIQPSLGVGDVVLIARRSQPDVGELVRCLDPDAPGRFVIGRVVADHPGLVVTRTALGASRIVDVPDGALLPRIC